MDVTNLFYTEVLGKLLKQGLITPDMSVLAVCAGQKDQQVLLHHGFKEVTISNLDERMKGPEFHPYVWSYQDAEAISFEDNSFDLVVVHAGLHHCYSPHKALLEMYRVARKGVLAFEGRDSFLISLADKLNFAEYFELSAVRANGFKYGGVGNTAIPNYIYRWTEREVIKTVYTFSPAFKHAVKFFYGLELPWFEINRNKKKAMLVKLAYPFLLLFTKLFPKQSNGFAFFLPKEEDSHNLQPWLKMVDDEIHADGAYIGFQ